MNPLYLVVKPCPECGAPPSANHARGCIREDCAVCGPMRPGAYDGAGRSWPPEHRKHPKPAFRVPWDGVGDGVIACQDVGWFSYFDEKMGRWVQCSDGPEADPDVNRVVKSLRGLISDRLRWNPETKKWVVGI